VNSKARNEATTKVWQSIQTQFLIQRKLFLEDQDLKTKDFMAKQTLVYSQLSELKKLKFKEKKPPYQIKEEDVTVGDLAKMNLKFFYHLLKLRMCGWEKKGCSALISRLTNMVRLEYSQSLSSYIALLKKVKREDKGVYQKISRPGLRSRLSNSISCSFSMSLQDSRILKLRYGFKEVLLKNSFGEKLNVESVRGTVRIVKKGKDWFLHIVKARSVTKPNFHQSKYGCFDPGNRSELSGVFIATDKMRLVDSIGSARYPTPTFASKKKKNKQYGLPSKLTAKFHQIDNLNAQISYWQALLWNKDAVEKWVKNHSENLQMLEKELRDIQTEKAAWRKILNPIIADDSDVVNDGDGFVEDG
jgi:hypothetical protein